VGGWNVTTDWVVQGVGDFNGDGKTDILWRQSGTGSTVTWLMNGGTVQSTVGGWIVPTDWVVQSVGDFNGDGRADILWRQNGTGSTVMWLMNAGAPTTVGGWNVTMDWGVQRPAPPSVTLAWQDNSTNENGFKIERSLDGSTNWTEIGTTGPNITTYQDVGLASWTTYHYRVRAYSASSTSTYSNAIGGTTP
jgi:hypothetical protein